MSSRSSLCPILAGALLFSLSAARAQAPLTVTVDGKPVDFGGAAPTQIGGRTLVPLRAIFEALGAQVEFNNGAIRARRGATDLSLALGSTAASVNGVSKTLEVPAQSVFGRTLVPLRFVGEALGAGVNFNPVSNLISITSPGGSGGASGGATGSGTGTGMPYTVPGAGAAVNGTLVKIDLTAPATITITQNGALRTYPLAENPLALRQVSLATSASATPVRQSARQIALSNIVAGDEVRVSLDGAGRASQVTATATVIAARVQFAGGTQIVLDDERDTTLTLGPNLRFLDARGRVSNDASSLAPGQSIGLFISRDTKAIYQVSAYAPDFTASSIGATTPDPITGPTTLPGNGTPQIQLVQHSATTPLKAGSRLDVTVRATPGLRASFSLGAKVQNVPLTENPAQPGVYSGSYIVKAGDDVLEGRVSARVLAASGAEFLAQGEVPITLDTIAPRLVGTFPANGAQISVAQPNIAIFADDLGGSGLGRANIDLLTGGTGVNRVTTRIAATVAPPTSVNAVAPATLSGPVDVRASIFDKAGNVLRVNFGFTVVATGASDISSFSHGANRALGAGDDVPLVLLAPPAGRATFDVISGAKTLARDVPLVEVEAGTYRATYRVPASALGNLRFIGKFNGGGQTSQLEATTKVQIAGLPTRLTVQTPTEGDKVASPLVVRGQASPGATIDVSLRAEGTQFFILEYKQELGVQQVRADANGNWTTNLDLPALRNVSGLKFTISATQTDAAGKTSDPISVTVTR
ncbi:Copper amine oxidase N-terminal domain-containing protein [Abditibacterium utsteinense]|uniref:Copper amine oxidase N-terminal domain-containing protein n=1 Tax=Abditibacterium utsteinense TaxID=1960156 RepID=A0A2S8SS91_9BACT|nr:copper amine oxidase N-terminal domain-containing protein [Abditibacterium utsteinense]PQV63657.1 Copper amine oxidase N-terminal domain-containing protein [Abditibacterium utsteinense]